MNSLYDYLLYDATQSRHYSYKERWAYHPDRVVLVTSISSGLITQHNNQ